jgi:hypothetical protein
MVLIMIRWVHIRCMARSHRRCDVTLGYWKNAIPFLRRTRVAIYEGVYVQAREFYGQRRPEYDAPIRIGLHPYDLLHQLSPIHLDRFAHNITGSIGREKHDDLRTFDGTADPPKGNHLCEISH